VRRDRETCLFRGRIAQFWHTADTREAWKRRWEEYSLSEVYHWAEKGALGVYRRGFLKHLPRRGTILEAGCGSGRYVRALMEHGFRIVGIEWEFGIIRLAYGVWPQAPLVCGDVRRFPFPDESMSATISLGVIEHFEDPWQVLQDTLRVLEPGGILYLVVPYASFLRRRRAARGKYHERVSREGFYQFLLSDSEIESGLERLGLTVRASFATGGFAGLADEFPRMGALARRLPYSSQLINVLNSIRLLGSLAGHVVHYVAQKDPT
jgi:SAM-dependent methyltransferase